MRRRSDTLALAAIIAAGAGAFVLWGVFVLPHVALALLWSLIAMTY
jgi:hypothetical protein